MRTIKYTLAEKIGRCSALTGRAFPFLAGARAQRLLLWLYGSAAGFLGLANPAPVARDVIEKEGLSAFRFDFAAEAEAFIYTLARGLAAERP